MKGKEDKERYSHLNVEFQRIAKRHKEAFLSENAKKYRKTIEWKRLENLIKKIRDTKRTFHANIGTRKARNNVYLKKQKRLRRGGRNTQKNCTKIDLNVLENHNGVTTHLGPDILA